MMKRKFNRRPNRPQDGRGPRKPMQHQQHKVNITLPHLVKAGRDFATESMVPKQRVYGEFIFERDGKSYRMWNPKRSKFAAAMLKGMEFKFKGDEKMLYLGVSSGTTASHLSDIFREGTIYGIDLAPRVLREFALLARTRSNLVPILANGAKPEEYSFLVPKVDVLYQDVAQSNQTDILIRNAKAFLKEGGVAIYMIKSRSIDVAKQPAKVFEEEQAKLREAGFKTIDRRKLEPFERDHLALMMTWEG